MTPDVTGTLGCSVAVVMVIVDVLTAGRVGCVLERPGLRWRWAGRMRKRPEVFLSVTS